jgi:hypothetical protein
MSPVETGLTRPIEDLVRSGLNVDWQGPGGAGAAPGETVEDMRKYADTFDLAYRGMRFEKAETYPLFLRELAASAR